MKKKYILISVICVCFTAAVVFGAVHMIKKSHTKEYLATCFTNTALSINSDYSDALKKFNISNKPSSYEIKIGEYSYALPHDESLEEEFADPNDADGYSAGELYGSLKVKKTGYKSAIFGTKELGCDVVETTGMPPSVNGMRLRDVLLSALKKKGIRVIENAKAEEAITEGNKVTAIMAGGEVRAQKYEADKFILATGGFYSGGITMRDFGEYNEGVFGLPVQGDCVEEKWVNKQLFSDKKQGFAMAGVRVNDSLRGVDESGNVVLENVYVVGRNLSGYDFCFEHSGNGVALASAYKAAKA